MMNGSPPQDLVKAIKGTVSGKSYVDPNIAGRLLSSYSSTTNIPSPPPTNYNFSEREYDVLKLLAQGLSNADIAQQLFLTEGTVRNYTSEIFKKMGVSDRTQAAVVALRYGLADLE
jgi:NarL family two-component system response regulator LiaR